jgi:hypothetical protein
MRPAGASRVKFGAITVPAIEVRLSLRRAELISLLKVQQCFLEALLSLQVASMKEDICLTFRRPKYASST